MTYMLLEGMFYSSVKKGKNDTLQFTIGFSTSALMSSAYYCMC